MVRKGSFNPFKMECRQGRNHRPCTRAPVQTVVCMSDMHTTSRRDRLTCRRMLGSVHALPALPVALRFREHGLYLRSIEGAGPHQVLPRYKTASGKDYFQTKNCELG